MLRANLSRLLIGAALAAGAAALYAGEAAADRRIVIGAGGNAFNCIANDTTFFAEAMGKDIFNTTLCEAWTQGGTAISQCPLGVIKHQARIIQRVASTLRPILPAAQTSAEQFNWTATTSTIRHDIPSGPNCPATFINAVSQGREVP